MAWPDDIESLSTTKSNTSPMADDHPAHHNALARLVNALQTELGTNPAGSSGTVADRLSEIGDPFDIVAALGDLLIGNGADAVGRLPLGSNGEVLTVDTTQPLRVKWSSTSAAGGALLASLFDTKGEILSASSNDTVAKITIPTSPDRRNQGVLVTDNSTPSGWRVSFKASDYNLVEAGVTTGAVDTATASNNTAIINTAIDAARAAGVALFIPPVTIEYAHGMLIPSNTHIRGCGKGRSILKTHSSQGVGETVHNSDMNNGNHNVTLENFEFDGNKVARGAPDAYRPDPVMGLLNIRGSTTPCTNWRLLNMSIHHEFGLGVAFHGIDGAQIIGCDIYSNNRDGCSILSSATQVGRNVLYAANRFWDLGDDCIGLGNGHPTSPIKNIAIVGNYLGNSATFPAGGQGGGHGVAVVGCMDVTIMGNVLSQNYAAGVQVSDGVSSNVGTSRVAIVGNVMGQEGVITGKSVPTANNQGGWGVEVTGKHSGTIKDITIANNEIVQATNHGVYLAKWSGTSSIQNIRILGNNFVGGIGGTYWSDAAGVFAENAMSFITIKNNTFLDVRGKAIHSAGAGNWWFVRNNEIISANRSRPGTGGAAVTLPITNLAFTGNTISDLQGPRGSSHAVDFTGATGFCMGNDFNTGGYTGTFASMGSMKQAMNVNNTGTLYAGTSTAGNMLS